MELRTENTDQKKIQEQFTRALINIVWECFVKTK